MANLDTRSKRASSVQIFAPYNLAPPEPTLLFGEIDHADRQHIAWSYSGILVGGVFVPPPPVPVAAVNARRGGIIIIRDEFNFEEDDDELAVLMAIMGQE